MVIEKLPSPFLGQACKKMEEFPTLDETVAPHERDPSKTDDSYPD